jgi:hypothetical protein
MFAAASGAAAAPWTIPALATLSVPVASFNW